MISSIRINALACIFLFGICCGIRAETFEIDEDGESEPFYIDSLPTLAKHCVVRCYAQCRLDKESLECDRYCEDIYGNASLCSNASEAQACWDTCDGLISEDLLPLTPLAIPARTTAVYGDEGLNPYKGIYSWTPVSEASIYWIQIFEGEYHVADVFDSGTEFRFDRPAHSTEKFCEQNGFRVAAVSPFGVSEFSQPAILDAPAPNIVPPGFLNVKEIKYRPNIPFLEYENTSMKITLGYKSPPFWKPSHYLIRTRLNRGSPLSQTPGFQFHVNCPSGPNGEPPSNDLANPLAFANESLSEIYLYFGTSMLPYKCFFLLSLDKLESVCGNSGVAPYIGGIQEVVLSCDIEGSPCGKNYTEPLPSPQCMVNNISMSMMTKHGAEVPVVDYQVHHNYEDEIDPKNLTVKISWTSNIPEKYKGLPILYYKLRWGEAEDDPRLPPEIPLATFKENATVIEMEHKHDIDTNESLSLNYSASTLLYGLLVEQIYGVQICAIFDKATDSIPERINTAEKLKVTFAQKNERAPPQLLIAVLVPLGASILISVPLVFALWRRSQHKKMKLAKAKSETERQSQELSLRYTELPRKTDEWEIERRRLIIYEDQKLGSGAFGSVFKGKVVGKLSSHKDSLSSLATNLIRIENCDVAVKMLPEYADEISKADFLKEINLMKSLGFHERLANMLACLTESEPYCLVVEYCSDGDLLHFLRLRRKYMVKLDELGIDYTNPKPDDDVDTNMVLSLKELLGYSLQISYGLEYLSQKGFIHRDVAARNVLVHDKRFVKIGDFGLCRYVFGSDTAYWGKGGRLPIKWMAPEAIKHYEFTIKSDVWSFGVLLFEIITLGGSPYPSIQPADMESFLENGGRMSRPDNCPTDFYGVMNKCWEHDPETRITFSDARQQLAKQLEEVTSEYSYLKLDAERDYYNVTTTDSHEFTEGEVAPGPFAGSQPTANWNGSKSKRTVSDRIPSIEEKPDEERRETAPSFFLDESELTSQSENDQHDPFRGAPFGNGPSLADRNRNSTNGAPGSVSSEIIATSNRMT